MTGSGHIYQNYTRINKLSQMASFTKIAYCAAIDDVVKHDKALHILGVVSQGGVHDARITSAMIKLAAERGAQRIFTHF